MYHQKFITAIIPALNEEEAITQVIADLPDYIDLVIVADNGSSDNTAQRAKAAGARVVHEERRGYGAACLRGVEAIDERTDIILFIDGDYSDYPEESNLLLDPIVSGKAELVIGSRMLSARSRKVLTPVAAFGNSLSTTLIRLFWGCRFSDLGPFRAITKIAYQRLGMSDRDFGWTVEMQVRAAKLKILSTEVAVSYRKRIGQSKISGTIIGSIRAGSKILYIIGRELIRK